jgi:predicted RNA binding protein YcfA (HicA-like mRNA interferase family)
MKRVDRIKIITGRGAVLFRHGGNHDIYVQPNNGNTEPVPRHNEIKEFMAKKIIKNLS